MFSLKVLSFFVFTVGCGIAQDFSNNVNQLPVIVKFISEGDAKVYQERE
jgi:hypothetical protein